MKTLSHKLNFTFLCRPQLCRTFAVFTFVLLGSFVLVPESHAKKKAIIRTPNELIIETKIWIDQMEAVIKSGKTLRIKNKSAKNRKRLAKIIGPYVPVDKVSFLEIRPDGTATMTFRKKHIIDIPDSKTKGYLRIIVLPRKMEIVLLNATTANKKIPVKVLAFLEPRSLIVDNLDSNRKSTISPLGKLLGLSPHIIALVFRESEEGNYVAPQLDGLGAKENGRLIRSLLKIDDTLLPELFSDNPR